MIREYVTLAVLAALMSTLTRRPAHPAERGDGPGRAGRRGRGRAVRRPGRRRHRRGRRQRRAGRVAGPGQDRERAAGCGGVHGRRGGRRRRRGVRRGRGRHRAALVDHAGSERPRRRGPRGRVPAQRHREHARHRRRQRPAGRRAPGRRGCPRSAGASRCARSAATTGGRSACSPSRSSSCSARRACSPARRDVGSGMWPSDAATPRPHAGSLSPSGLVWRLQRGALLGWAVGMLGFGLIFGAIIEQIEDVEGATAEWYERMGGTDQIVDAYSASMIADGRHGRRDLRSSDAAADAGRGSRRAARAHPGDRGEPATMGGGHVLNAGLGALVLLWSSRSAWGWLPDRCWATCPRSFARLARGRPGPAARDPGDCRCRDRRHRAAAAVGRHGLVGGVLVSLLLGPLFGPRRSGCRSGRWTSRRSPTSRRRPAADVTAVPVVSLLAISAVLAVAGLVAFRRRNLALPV